MITEPVIKSPSIVISFLCACSFQTRATISSKVWRDGSARADRGKKHNTARSHPIFLRVGARSGAHRNDSGAANHAALDVKNLTRYIEENVFHNLKEKENIFTVWCEYYLSVSRKAVPVKNKMCSLVAGLLKMFVIVYQVSYVRVSHRYLSPRWLDAI